MGWIYGMLRWVCGTIDGHPVLLRHARTGFGRRGCERGPNTLDRAEYWRDRRRHTRYLLRSDGRLRSRLVLRFGNGYCGKTDATLGTLHLFPQVLVPNEHGMAVRALHLDWHT